MLRNKAFTLVEIVIAMLILAVAVIPVAALIGKDAKNTVVIANAEYAVSLARNTMDKILDATDFDELNSKVDTVVYRGITFTLELEVSDLEFADDDKIFSYYKTPNLLNDYLNNNKYISAINTENGGKPSFDIDGFGYNNYNEAFFGKSEFMNDTGINLLKKINLTISWKDATDSKDRSINVIAHKARLKSLDRND